MSVLLFKKQLLLLLLDDVAGGISVNSAHNTTNAIIFMRMWFMRRSRVLKYHEN